MRRILATLTVLTLALGCLAAQAQPSTRDTGKQSPTTTTAPVDWPAIIRRQQNERAWWAEHVRQQRAHAAYLRLLRYAAAVAASRECRGYGCVQGIRVCDAPGLVPCSIVHRESRFDPHARNRSSTAGGLYQFLRAWLRECRITGYSNMADVPVARQVECARHAVRTQGLAPWRLTR